MAISSSVTRSIAAERNGTLSVMPAIVVWRDASEGSILLSAGRMSTSSKVNPSETILLDMTYYTHFTAKVNAAGHALTLLLAVDRGLEERVEKRVWRERLAFHSGAK